MSYVDTAAQLLKARGNVVLNQLLPVALRTPLGVPLCFGVACLFGVVECLVPHTH